MTIRMWNWFVTNGAERIVAGVTSEALRAAGKTYVFHRYDGAGHAILAYDRPSYRPQQAMDAWNKIFGFFDQYLLKS